MRFRRDLPRGMVEVEVMSRGEAGYGCAPFESNDRGAGGVPEQKLNVFWEGQQVQLRGPRELLIEVARAVFEAYRVEPSPTRVEVVVRHVAAPPRKRTASDPERAEVEAIKRGLRR